MDLPEKPTELLDFTTAIRPLARFLRGDSKKYDGYSTENAQNTSFLGCPYKSLSRGNLKYSLEEQNRDKIDEVLAVAFRLGMEQGYRQRLVKEKDEEFCRVAEKAQKTWAELMENKG